MPCWRNYVKYSSQSYSCWCWIWYPLCWDLAAALGWEATFIWWHWFGSTPTCWQQTVYNLFPLADPYSSKVIFPSIIHFLTIIRAICGIFINSAASALALWAAAARFSWQAISSPVFAGFSTPSPASFWSIFCSGGGFSCFLALRPADSIRNISPSSSTSLESSWWEFFHYSSSSFQFVLSSRLFHEWPLKISCSMGPACKETYEIFQPFSIFLKIIVSHLPPFFASGRATNLYCLRKALISTSTHLLSARFALHSSSPQPDPSLILLEIILLILFD